MHLSKFLDSPSIRFVSFFCLAFLLGFIFVAIPWVAANCVAPLTSGLAWLSTQLIHLGGGLAEVADSEIRHPINGFAIKIANGCNGIDAVILFAAGIVAFPSTWRQRAVGWFAGTMVIMSINVVRVISLYYIGQYSMVAFDWAHLYAWDILIMIDGLVVFFLWIKWLPSGSRTQDASLAA